MRSSHVFLVWSVQVRHVLCVLPTSCSGLACSGQTYIMRAFHMVLQVRHILSVHTTSCIVGLVVHVRHGATHILYCSFDRLGQMYFMRAYHFMYCWFGLFRSDIYYACIPHHLFLFLFFCFGR